MRAIAAILGAADKSGFDSFHVLGYSLGADVGIALAAMHPDRLRSLALIEPDWIGSQERLTPQERTLREEHSRLAREFQVQKAMQVSERLLLIPGIERPSPSP